MDVDGVALATVIATVISSGLMLFFLLRHPGQIRLSLKQLRLDKEILSTIVRIGVPTGIQGMLYSFSNVQIQAAINSYGVSAIAGNSAAASLEAIFNAFAGAFGSTAIVFIGQNMGAKRNDRARQAMKQCLAIGCTVGVILGVSIYLTGNFWLSLYLPDDPLGIQYGKIRMLFVMLFNSVSSAKGVFAAALQNCGYIPYTTLCSIFGIFGFRLLWMWCVYPFFSNFYMLMACFLISWSLVLICYIAGYFKFCRPKLK
jgi:Na+-driven multidrug efflux pump